MWPSPINLLPDSRNNYCPWNFIFKPKINDFKSNLLHQNPTELCQWSIFDSVLFWYRHLIFNVDMCRNKCVHLRDVIEDIKMQIYMSWAHTDNRWKGYGPNLVITQECELYTYSIFFAFTLAYERGLIFRIHCIKITDAVSPTSSDLALFIKSVYYASSSIKLQVCKFYRPSPVCHNDQFSVYTSPCFKIQIASCIKFMRSIARPGFYFTVWLTWGDRENSIFFFIFYSPLPFSWSSV